MAISLCYALYLSGGTKLRGFLKWRLEESCFIWFLYCLFNWYCFKVQISRERIYSHYVQWCFIIFFTDITKVEIFQACKIFLANQFVVRLRCGFGISYWPLFKVAFVMCVRQVRPAAEPCQPLAWLLIARHTPVEVYTPAEFNCQSQLQLVQLHLGIYFRSLLIFTSGKVWSGR